MSMSAAVMAFSHDLPVALYSQGRTPDGAGVALEEVIERHSATVKISREPVRTVNALGNEERSQRHTKDRSQLCD